MTKYRCHICGKTCSSSTIVTEERYFLGEQTICNSCFDKWASSDYDELDKLAMAKIMPDEVRKND